MVCIWGSSVGELLRITYFRILVTFGVYWIMGIEKAVNQEEGKQGWQYSIWAVGKSNGWQMENPWGNTTLRTKGDAKLN